MGAKNLDAAIDQVKGEGVETSVSWEPFMIDPGTQENGEDYLAYNRRRWGSDGWTHSLRAKGRKVGAPFANWKIWPNTLRAHQLLRFAPREKEKCAPSLVLAPCAAVP